MKCYYEVLGVERDAEEKEIKTSYRKLALRWHPDKNMDRLDEAKEQFQLLQAAYEVLSDPQERAWYDKHREEILRGKDSNYEDSCLDVFAYFTSSCFKGYGDDPKGFFAVYREVFEQIATEDIEFYEDPDEVEAIPKFGDSTSSYDEVVGPFYAHWQAYCTKKSYAWLCPFNVKEYRDRRILREIEKETKKIVQKAKRERNEEVRNLVSFIRKRDPRVKAYKQQLEERAAENRKKQEQNRLEQFKRRKQEVEEMKKTHQNIVPDGYEEQLRKLAQDYGGSEEEDEFTDDEEGEGESDEAAEDEVEAEEVEYVDDLYCVACNKSFKNQNAFANHESSKKHKENVQRMRSEMEEEEEMYLNSNDKGDSDLEGDIEDDDEEAALDDLVDRIDEDLVLEEDDIRDLSEASDGGVPLPMPQSKSSKKSKKKKRKQVVEVVADEDDEDVEAVAVEEVVPEPDDSAVESRKGSKKSKKAKRKQATKALSDEELPEEAPTEPSASFEEEPAKGKKKAGKQKAKAKSQQAGDSSASAGESDEEDEEAPVKQTKPTENPSQTTTNTSSLSCAKCGATFPSKNKLFAHLKLTQHSIYLPKPPAADEPKGKKAKDKKKKK